MSLTRADLRRAASAAVIESRQTGGVGGPPGQANKRIINTGDDIVFTGEAEESVSFMKQFPAVVTQECINGGPRWGGGGVVGTLALSDWEACFNMLSSPASQTPLTFKRIRSMCKQSLMSFAGYALVFLGRLCTAWSRRAGVYFRRRL